LLPAVIIRVVHVKVEIRHDADGQDGDQIFNVEANAFAVGSNQVRVTSRFPFKAIARDKTKATK